MLTSAFIVLLSGVSQLEMSVLAPLSLQAMSLTPPRSITTTTPPWYGWGVTYVHSRYMAFLHRSYQP